MEQNNRLFQFVVENETFVFEAPNQKAAELSRKYAVLHFQETLGKKITEKHVIGPEPVSHTSYAQKAA